MQRIVVSDLADETFRARIVLEQGGETREIDARPSDAIALAIRAQVPIFATDAVLDRAGVIPESDEERAALGLPRVRQLAGRGPRDGRGPDEPPAEERRRSTDAAPRPGASWPRWRVSRGSASAAPSRSRQDRHAPAQRGIAVGPEAQAQQPEVAHRARARPAGRRPTRWPAVRG